MGWWDSISDVDQLPKWYPDEAHAYNGATSYITYNDVVTLTGDGFPIGLTASLTLPSYTIEATTWNFGNVAAVLPLLTVNGTRNNFAVASLALPLLRANGLIGALTGDMVANLPMLTISAGATQANLVSLAKSLPKMKISGIAHQYNRGTVNKNLPVMSINAAASFMLSGTLAKSLPMMTIRGEAAMTERFADTILRHTNDVWGGVEVEIPMMTISAEAA